MAGKEGDAVRGKAVAIVPRSSSKKAVKKEGESAAGETDLQRAFERFKLSRIGSGSSRPAKVSRSPEFKSALRQAFIEQAKKYIGVPYAKKYISPDNPEYHSPLFLDCCALVRKAVNELGDKFGFMLGPWNQNYQIDMLPDTGIKSHEELQPGDLIFYYGVYFDPNRRKQKHGMTHVEIWLGPGEQSIGSRKSVGRVSLHDSYIFTSQSYHSTVHHYRSIEPWLDGVCVSYCPEHKWKRKSIPTSSRSIFSAGGSNSASGSSLSEKSAASAAADAKGKLKKAVAGRKPGSGGSTPTNRGASTPTKQASTPVAGQPSTQQAPASTQVSEQLRMIEPQEQQDPEQQQQQQESQQEAQ
eukprot:tig00020538_g10314.t1